MVIDEVGDEVELDVELEVGHVVDEVEAAGVAELDDVVGEVDATDVGELEDVEVVEFFVALELVVFELLVVVAKAKEIFNLVASDYLYKIIRLCFITR